MTIDLQERRLVVAQPEPSRPGIRVGDIRLPAFDASGRARARRAAVGIGRGTARGTWALLRRLAAAVRARRVGLAVFLPAFALYVTVGALLTFRYSSLAGDAQSRVANAFYVLYSRDPHLGAIGFVWNPLPSLTVMPLLLLKGLWPPLATYAFAGNIMSAAFMAGNVVILHGMLRELRVRVPARVALVGLFAVHPMIILYGANGMSEAVFMFFLLLTSRSMARWLHSRGTWDLVLAGAALALAYLTRYEAVLPAVTAAAVVTAVSAARTPGGARLRLRRAVVNGFLFASPAAFAFLVWATLSWIIVGHPLEQFSSQYGNASQLVAGGTAFSNTRGGLAPPVYLAMQLGALAPTLPLGVLAGGWAVLRRRDLRVLAPVSVLGGVLLFEAIVFLTGNTAGWLRYQMTAIPLAVLLVGAFLARPDRSPARSWPRSIIATVVAVALTLPAIGTTIAAMTDTRIAHEENQRLGFVFNPDSHHALYKIRYSRRSAMQMASYLDALHLPRGAVVVDNFTPCTPLLLLASHHPKSFVITNDRDF
jgi:hypothetical protein